MNLRFHTCILCLVAGICCVSALAKDKVTSIEGAYKIVVAYAKGHHIGDNHPGEYYCDYAPGSAGYFVVGLHHTDETAPKDWFGSTLVGWYGVRRKDCSIVAWDVAADLPGKKLSLKEPIKIITAQRASRVAD